MKSKAKGLALPLCYMVAWGSRSSVSRAVIYEPQGQWFDSRLLLATYRGSCPTISPRGLMKYVIIIIIIVVKYQH